MKTDVRRKYILPNVGFFLKKREILSKFLKILWNNWYICTIILVSDVSEDNHGTR